MCKKNNFQISSLFVIEMTALNGFFAKKGLGPSEVMLQTSQDASRSTKKIVTTCACFR